MNIGIVELKEKNHHSMIFNWISIANTNSWQITLFTTLEVFKNVEQEIEGLEYNLVIQKGSRYHFLRELKDCYKKSNMDRLIFLSVTSSFLELFFISFKKVNTLITVHNANAWFYKNEIRKISHLIKRIVRAKLIKNSLAVIVNSDNMKIYIEEKFKNNKPIHVLPFSLKRTSKSTKRNKKFTVVYPGSVNVNRKNYEKFILLAEKNPDDSFIILGSYVNDLKSQNIFKKMKKVTNIKVFENYVTLTTFDDVMSKCDLLFSDLVTEFNLSDLSEKYGTTKDSGISYLMIQFNKISIINKDFLNLKELKDCTFAFNDFTELQEIYSYLKTNKHKLSVFESRIEENCKDFNLDFYSKQMINL